jgi:hypothetical protein
MQTLPSQRASVYIRSCSITSLACACSDRTAEHGRFPIGTEHASLVSLFELTASHCPSDTTGKITDIPAVLLYVCMYACVRVGISVCMFVCKCMCVGRLTLLANDACIQFLCHAHVLDRDVCVRAHTYKQHASGHFSMQYFRTERSFWSKETREKAYMRPSG